MSSSGRVTTVSSADIVNGTIVDADVNASADIAVTKVAHVGANNVLKSNGTANVGGQVINADIALGTIDANSRLADGSVTTIKITPNNVTQAFFQNSGGATGNPGVTGGWVATGNNLSLTGLTVGSPILVWYTATAHHSIAGHALNVGLAFDVVASIIGTTYVSANVAGYYTQLAFVGQFTATATAHTLMEIINVSTATVTRAAGANILALEVKR